MTKRENYISLARVVCAFAVVMIHVNTCFQEFNLERCWFLANIIDSGLGFAVPVFIMISGATLLDYRDRYSTKEFFLKRVKRVFIPFLIWSCIGSVYMRMTDTVHVFFVYLFFGQLFIAYLSIPLFSFIKKEYRDKVFMVLIPVLFVFNIVFPNQNNYLFYLLIGYLLSKWDFSFQSKVIMYAASIIGFVIHIGGTYMLSVEAGEIVHTFRGYTNLPCCLSAVGVFLLMRDIGQKIKNEAIINFINSLSEYSYAIYLLHIYVIYLVINPLCLNTHTWIYKLIIPCIVFYICVIVAWIIRKIPFVRNVLP